ncbi:MAG TPA: hypothetical protein VEC39_07140 [Vicinamibacterales bacterium]|nr:hypothetical protein [Vicinamibacterales bacterium]
MKTLPRRRFALLLSAVVALLLWTGDSNGVTAARQGVHITANGWRTPLYGMSLVQNASGALGTSCEQLTAPQVEAARFGRRTSRAMLKSSPHAVVSAGGEGMKFEIIYSDAAGTGFNDNVHGATRRRALEAAAMAWSKVLKGSITVRIDAVMEEPSDEDTAEGNILLATAGPVDFWLVNNIGMPSSLAWQLQGRRDDGVEADIQVNVNPEINWEYRADGQATPDKVSFVYTLIHEIAHGLGFVDSFDPETGTLLNDPVPFIYDTFINRGNDQRRRVLTRPVQEIKGDMISKDLWFGGEHAIDASKRSIRPLPMIKLYAPNPYEAGSSIAHVDQDTYADFKTGVMTPRDFGNGNDKIDILTLGILRDLGYQLIPNAQTARVQ